MTKLLLLVIIIMVAFWLGKMSVKPRRKEVEKSKSEGGKTVIDIEPEDES